MESLLVQKRPGVAIDPAAGKHRIVYREDTREYFRLGIREADFLESLDGSKTADDLCAMNPQQFTPEQVDTLLAWFEQHRLLLIGDETPAMPDKKTASWYLLIWRFITRPDQFRFKLYNPDELLNRHRAIVDLFFSRAAIAGYLLLLLAPALVYLFNPQLVNEAAHHTRTLSLTGWIAVYVSLLLMNVLHELAHAIACKHFGGKVNKIGLMLLYLNPVIYCDVSDSWRFRNVNHKLVVTAAGILLQILLTSAGITLWLFTGSGVVLNFVLFNTAIAFFNFFPFIRLDGYWMLVHLLDEPNLRTKGLKALESVLRRLFSRNHPKVQPTSPMVMAWGIGHAIAIPLFWSLGLYGIYHRLSRASLPLALLLVCVFAAGILFRGAKIAVSLSRSIVQPTSP